MSYGPAMSEPNKTPSPPRVQPSTLPSFLLGIAVGFGGGLLVDPSCNPPELETQPMGKPAPPLPKAPD